MLRDPNDNGNNEGKKPEDKLLHADEANENVTDEVKANKHSLFGKTEEPRQDHGHDSLFDSSFTDDDGHVASSFAISFKANDPVNSVSDKLKEEETNASSAPQPDTSAPLQFEDDLADFEFDGSVSAFKPLGDSPAPAHVTKPEPAPQPAQPAKAEAPSPAPAAAAKDPFEGIDDVEKPKFNDEDEDFMQFTGMTDPKEEKLFKSGDDLDFATSTTDEAKSPFAHAEKPEDPKAKDIDIPSTNEAAKIKTYGTVASGVNAFKKAAPEQAPEQAPAPSPAPAKSPFAQQSAPEPVKAEPVKTEPVNEAPSKAEAPDAKPEDKKPEAGTAAAVASGAAAAAAVGNAEKPKAAPVSSALNTPATRPASRPQQQRPIFAEGKESGLRPGAKEKTSAPAARAAKNSSSANIAPVSQVNAKKKKNEPKAKKDPGKGGLITLAIVIAVFLGVFLVLDNIDKITNAFKGKNPVTTVATTDDTTSPTGAASSETEASSATTTEVIVDPTTTTTEATTTATTTEATTTATTTEATTTTTTEATTTATTTEATTTATTTEATTAATTEATTAATTAAPGTGAKVTNMKTSIKHFKKVTNGFRFDIIITNNSNKDASLAASLKNLTITLYSNKKIKNLTSEGFTFTRNGNTFTCTPIDRTIPAGGSVTIRVNVSTSGTPGHYGYNYAYFKWK